MFIIFIHLAVTFFNAVAIDRDTPVNSAVIRVIDRVMISQSVHATHHASISPAKNTRFIKMAARIEATASFSKWEKWDKTLETSNLTTK